jgi:hypothetical protein
VLKEQAFELCRIAGQQSGVDPKLLLAIALRESGQNGGVKDDEARLENAFFHRYTRGEGLSTTTAILLAASYGMMQVMGQSLKEMGYFDFYKGYHNDRNSFQIQDPLSEIGVPKAINAFMVRPPWQFEWGARWFQKKLRAAGSNVEHALLLWNGGGNLKYPQEVLAIMETIKA